MIHIAGFEFNIIAILVAIIISIALGILWYSPLLFGTSWLKVTKMSKKDINDVKTKNMTPTIIANALTTLLFVLVLRIIIDYANITSVFVGILTAFLLWAGLIATTSFNEVLWEKRPVKLWLINNGHFLMQTVVMTIIITMWV